MSKNKKYSYKEEAMKTRKLLAAVLCAAMSMSLLMGCGSKKSEPAVSESTSEVQETEQAEEGYKIGLICINMGIDYYRQVAYGIMEACEANNCELVIKSGITSVDTQLQAVEDLIQAGCKGIILSPIDSYGIATAVDACNAAGVSLISQADIYGADDTATCVMSTDNIWMGEIVAEKVVEDLGESGNVLVLLNKPGVANSVEKYEGMMNIFEKYSGITVLDALEDASELATAQDKMADALQTHGKEVDAVVSVNELGVLGAMNSLQEFGYKCGEDVLLYSCNYATELDDYIKDGICNTGIYSWGNLFGSWSVEMIIRDQQGLPVPDHINLPATFVTADNIDKYSPMSLTAHNFDFDAYLAE